VYAPEPPSRPAPLRGSAALRPVGTGGTGPYHVGVIEPRPIARLQILAGAYSCACLLGAACGFFAAGFAGESSPFRLGESDSAALGALPAALGCLVSLAMLRPAASRTPPRLARSCLKSMVVRALVVIVLGVIAHRLLFPAHVAYFASLYICMVLSAAVEFGWATLALRRFARGGSAHPPEASA
jgi:hypothetical protein